MSYQKITLVGNLGSVPEMRYAPNGKPVTNFSLATNRQYTASNGEKVKETVWWRVSVWDSQAEACNNYLKQGSKVLVEGRMNHDKETGGPRVYKKSDDTYGSNYELVADRVVFLNTKGDSDEPF